MKLSLLKHFALICMILLIHNYEKIHTSLQAKFNVNYIFHGTITQLTTKSDLLNRGKISTSGYLHRAHMGLPEVIWAIYETREAALAQDQYYGIPILDIPEDCVNIINDEWSGIRIKIISKFSHYRNSRINGWNYLYDIEQVDVLSLPDLQPFEKPVSCYKD